MPEVVPVVVPWVVPLVVPEVVPWVVPVVEPVVVPMSVPSDSVPFVLLAEHPARTVANTKDDARRFTNVFFIALSIVILWKYNFSILFTEL